MTEWDSLRRRVAAIQEPLVVILAARDRQSATAQAARELLDDLLSDHPVVTYLLADGPEDAVITLERDGHTDPVSFWGVPSGFELEGLVRTMEAAVGHLGSAELPQGETAELVRQISRGLEVDLYVAPT